MDRHRDAGDGDIITPGSSRPSGTSRPAAQSSSPPPTSESHSPALIRSRIANACDGCKARKVKCDGHQPCSYCVRRQRPHACHYSPQRRPRRQQRRQHQQQQQQQQEQVNSPTETPLPSSSRRLGLPRSPPTSAATTATRDTTREPEQSGGHGHADARSPSGAARHATSPTRPGSAATPPGRSHPTAMDASPEDDTEVPREARLLCDPQGKLVFIGDCAPLSLFQSVRQIVTRYVGPDAFAPETSRYSVLENASGEPLTSASSSLAILSHNGSYPEVRPADVSRAVSNLYIVAAGLIDLFDKTRLTEDIILWANLEERPHNLASAINYLILAIGRHRDDEAGAQIYFEHARDHAWRSLSGNLGVGTSQAFLLITLYMLCSSQINSAFLVFGVAVRAAHSIGIHRTEVNARFGPDIHRQRDRLWKSLRVVDLFLSTSMGRPPSTSDVDCTVPYRSLDDKGEEEFDLLNASVQILLILETIVLEIYSRRKISLQLTEGVSLQLREWSSQWLNRLKDVLAQPTDPDSPPPAAVIANMRGACQVLSTYYYAVMLVSRPFLMYELCRRLSDAPPTNSLPRRPSTLISGKSKLADACIDAASLMVDPILDLIERGVLVGRMPVLVSWLFAASLVLGVGLLGGFGRILDRYTRMSIRALDYFAKSDTHAHQYSLIAQSLLDTAIDNLERREMQERLRRTESSSQLFGLLPPHGILPRQHGSSVSPSASAAASLPPRDESSMRFAAHDAGHMLSPAAASSIRRRESLDRSYLPQQQAQHNHHSSFYNHQQLYPQQQHTHHSMLQTSSTSAQSPRFGDIDSAFLGLSDSMMPTPEANFWAPYMGTEGDQGSTLNLFPLLEAGGGIDLANYL